MKKNLTTFVDEDAERGLLTTHELKKKVRENGKEEIIYGLQAIGASFFNPERSKELRENAKEYKRQRQYYQLVLDNQLFMMKIYTNKSNEFLYSPIPEILIDKRDFYPNRKNNKRALKRLGIKFL